ncbi:hypothetical protein EI94DRAFT_1294377 [Lactarius quietus]|nr:hypothetical protein EI94DRAFT_1294377 [Lactarius quietus]
MPQAFSWRSNAYSWLICTKMVARLVARGKSGSAMVGIWCTLSPPIHLADSFLAHRIPLLSPAAMAKDIKTRACSLWSFLECVEIKHPLVRAIRPARSSISLLITVLDSSPSACVGYRVCRSGTKRNLHLLGHLSFQRRHCSGLLSNPYP